MVTILNIGDKEYQAKLTTLNLVALEKDLGTNPINVLIGMAQNGANQLPSVEFIAKVLMYSLKKYQPKINLNSTYEIIDDYLEDEEHDLTTLIELVMTIFTESGLFRRPEEQPTEDK